MAERVGWGRVERGDGDRPTPGQTNEQGDGLLVGDRKETVGREKRGGALADDGRRA